MRILIVEDDAITQRIISGILNSYGYDTVTANSVGDAIHLLEKNAYIDLIISDILMPGTDGFTFLKKLHIDERFSRIPVIMCSVLNDKQAVRNAIKLGAKGYVSKPIDKENLLAHVKQVIDRYIHTILIVDDEQTIGNVLSGILERNGFKTIYCHSAEEVLELDEQNAFNLAIIDVVLPGMGGFDLMAELKKKIPHLPVLIITGRDFSEKMAKERGADGFVRKPFKTIDIIQNIIALLKRARIKKESRLRDEKSIASS